MATGLVLRMSADSSDLVSGMNDASKATRGLSGESRELTRREKKLLGVLGGVTAGVTLLMRRTIEYGDFLDKTSQKVGVSVEALSSYKMGAELAGTSQQGLISGLQRLQKNMGTALRTPTSAAAQAFQRLGIDITDSTGKLRNVENLLPEFAQRISELEDGTTKTGIAMDLMGRSGAELIPFLNGGAEGMANMREEAESLGLVMSDEAVKASAAFNDAITRLKGSADGFFQTAATFYLPTLTDIAEGSVLAMRAVLGLDEAQKRAEENRAAAQGIITERAEAVSNLRAAIEEERRSIKETADLIGVEIWESDKLVELNAELERALGIHTATKEQLGAQAGLLTESIRLQRQQARERAEAALTGAPGAPAGGAAGAPRGAAADPAAAALRERERAVAAYERALEQLSAVEQRVTVRSLSGGERILAQLEQERQAIERQRDAILENERLSAQERVRIRQQAADSIVALEHEAERRIFEVRRQEADEFHRLQLERIRASERANLQTQTHAATTLDAVGTMSDAVTQGIISNYGEQSAEAKRAAKTQFAIQQALSFAIAAINMAQAIAVASASAPAPANIPAIVAATATGVATMATIAATTIAGIADGGLPPGALNRGATRRHTVLAIRNDEAVLPPSATRDLEDTMALAKQATVRQFGGGGGSVRVMNDRPVMLNGREVGRIQDEHLIRSEERGKAYTQRVRTRMSG